MPSPGYDLKFATEVRKAFMYEPHNNEERDQLIWQPTRKLLDELAKCRPKQLTCFASQAYKWSGPAAGVARNLYLVGPDKTVMYLGMVFNKKASAAFRKDQIALDPSKTAKIIRTSLFREKYSWIMLCSTPQVGLTCLASSVRLFLRRSAPPLAKLPIRWLPSKEGDTIDRSISRLVIGSAREFPEEEYLRKRMEDDS